MTAEKKYSAQSICQGFINIILRMIKWCAYSASLCLLSAILVSSRIPTLLESIQNQGRLVVASRNGPTTYFEDAQGLAGFEYELAKRFADHLGVSLEIRENEDLAAMISNVGKSRGVHLAASGLTVTDKRKRYVEFGTPYLQVRQKLIYRSGTTKPKSPADLIGKHILVISDSAHAERLRELQRDYPELDWKEEHDYEMLDLLEMIHNGKLDYTIVDSNAYDMNKSLYPKAQVAFDISEEQNLAWAFPKTADTSLYKEAETFFSAIKRQGVIQDTLEMYYGHLGKLNYSDATTFAHRLDTRLPKWQDRLEKVANDEQLDWKLLAALSYQESHWNPRAKSPTGVRGFMMLTLNTAKDVGVTNRLDAMQSLRGGAKYFKTIRRRLPSRIEEPDRTWLALAAYNVGYGHLEDARVLTEHHDKNPDKWSDVREFLPLLSKRKYYKFTKHGYARGWEPVEYVKRIRNFNTIIAWRESEKLRLAQLEKQKASAIQFDQLSPVVAEAVKTIATTAL